MDKFDKKCYKRVSNLFFAFGGKLYATSEEA